VKRILVTGATGFIGAPCVELLAAQGFEVHGAALGASGGSDDAVIYHDVDLLDPEQVRHLFASVKPSHLLHLAWYVAPGKYWTSLENVRWVSAGLDLAREFADNGGTRAVFVGTCAEYQPSEEPLVEGVTLLRPGTLYGASKAALHLSAMAYLSQRGVSCSWAHLFYLFGPGEYSSRLVPSLMESLLAGDSFECARPDDVRDFLHVSDVAGALCALADSSVEGDVNIASGHPITVGELCRRFAEKLGTPDLVTYRQAAPDRSVIVGDATRLTREVGWRPRMDIDAAVAAAVDWWNQRATRPLA
jgi:nucleoside-diphosphate-sugar epimerase